MPFILLETSYQSPDYQHSVELRNAVLRQPLGLSLTAEDLQRDAGEWHIVCHEDDHLRGCLVVVPLADGWIQVRQVAVHPQAQRRGIGQALMDFAEGLGRQRGYTAVMLHARLPVVSFYERLGYRKVGEAFEEVTIAHWEMRKPL